MAHSIAFVDVGAHLRPDFNVLPGLAEHAALRLTADEAMARAVGRSVGAASARFVREAEPWPAGRVTLSLVWPVLTVVLRCGRARVVEYFDVSGILGATSGGALAVCEVSR